MSNSQDDLSAANSGISRRSLLKGAAWAAPVIAVAAAAPLASASPLTSESALSGGLSKTGTVAASGTYIVKSFNNPTYSIYDTGAMPWNSGLITATFSFSSNIGGNFYNNESGTPVGPLTTSNSITAGDGGVWTVVSVNASTLVLTSPSVTISSSPKVIDFPEIYASGTYTGTPTVSYGMSLANATELALANTTTLPTSNPV